MRRTQKFVCLLLLCSLCVAQDGPKPKPAPATDYELYSVVVENFVRKYGIKIVYIESETVTPYACPKELVDIEGDDIGRLCARLQRANNKTHRLESKLRVTFDYSMIAPEREMGPAGHDFGLNSYRPKLSADTSILRLSIPAVSDDGKAALVSVGDQKADELDVLRKKNGRWTLDPRPLLWRPPDLSR